jgi:hypothetical protein
MAGNDKPVMRPARAVPNGTDVDWADAESAATTREDQEVIQEVRSSAT